VPKFVFLFLGLPLYVCGHYFTNQTKNMKQSEINRLNSSKTTVSFCENTAAATAAIIPFAPKVAFIKGKIVLCESYIQQSDEPISGVRVSVDALRESIFEMVFPIGNAVFAYASSLTPPDEELMAKAKVTKSKMMDEWSKEKFATESARLVALGTTHAADILPMAITGTDLTDASAAVSLFDTVINSTRAAIVNRKTYGEHALTLLDQIMNVYLLKQLDPLANLLRFSNTIWFSNYRGSREIIDLGTTFTKLRVDAVDIEGDPIKGIQVSLKQAGVEKYKGKTDTGGELHIVKVEPGNYDIEYSKDGFVSQTETDYHFAPGSEKIHHIVMASSSDPINPPGFDVHEYHITSGGSMLLPSDPATPGTTQVYLLCVNGTCRVCTTDLPAVPCAGGFQLNLGVPYQGPLSGLGIDLTKSNFQFTNLGAADITVRIGTPV
jgi:hypothetical protein